MNIRPIYTNADYKKALKRVEELWGSVRNTPEGDELDILSTLIEKYEEGKFEILPPDPVEAIKFRMEQLGLKQADLTPYFGSASRVTEILQRKRKLTVNMIKALYANLGIPAESLLAGK
ncbi:MAG: helix-turn-helix domain-containing protein [Bacteroidia bacterium]